MEIIERAPAKINLGLDVVGRYADGYHELAMIMASVDLNDYVSLSGLVEDKIILTSNSSRIPLGPANDVYRAIELVRKRYGIKRGLRLHLDKRIPICAGLGGGSSDVAATLRGLNQLWQLGMTQAEMIDLGFEIGSDVPYCIQGGCALVTGKGQVVESLATKFSSWVVLVKPCFGISTRTVFAEIEPSKISRVAISEIKLALLTNDYSRLLTNMGNSLEDISIARKPVIQKIKDKMIKAGADQALMTGSGPTVFGLCQTEKQANRVVNSMRGFCREVYKVRILSD